MAKKTQLKDREGNLLYPVTAAECIIGMQSSGTSPEDKKIIDSLPDKILTGNFSVNESNANYLIFDIDTVVKDADGYGDGDYDYLRIDAATREEAGLMSASDKIKLDSIDANSNFKGLEQVLAYGVEWDIKVADPHLTRIGNTTLHKSLPIQSGMRGCIAQCTKIMYYLDAKDWNFKEGAETIAVHMNEANIQSNGYTFTKEITSLHAGLVRISNYNTGKVVAYATIESDPALNTQWLVKITKGAIDNINECAIDIIGQASRLDGYDGTVRVYVPGFYIKSESEGDKRRVWLSTTKIDNTWTYQPPTLIDAYRSTVLNAKPSNMGYLSTLRVDSAISVVNTASYCRGGSNRTANDKYLTGADGTTIDVFRSDLGKPRTTQSRAIFRTECKIAGNNMMSYDQYKNIFYWLYVVEYANFNCQEAFNTELTAEGFRQGGMGAGVTTINSSHWNWYNGYYPLTPCGYCNEFGNGTGVKDMVITAPSAQDGSTTQTYTFKVPRWRGFDNPFGDIWTNVDGIIIDADADNHPNNMNYVYTCQDPDKFADALNESYEKVGEEIHQDGYTKLFDLGEAAHIIPHVMGGNITQYKCDYHYTSGKNANLRTLILGGYAYYGGFAGLGDFSSLNGVGDSNAVIGFRSSSVIK